MARVKGAMMTRKRRNKTLKLAKSYWGSKSTHFKMAKQAVKKSGVYAYTGRKLKKRDFRRLWITRISAAVAPYGINYSRFMNGLKKAGVEMNRKTLSEMAINEAPAFAALVACSAGRIIGLVNGCRSDRPRIDDAMFESGAHVPDGLYQMIFGLAVLPEFQHRGVAAALLRQMIASSHTLGLAGIALTCKAEKIGYYARFGFVAQGVSASVHGGAVWYDMALENP